jgi:hypothetical protein
LEWISYFPTCYKITSLVSIIACLEVKNVTEYIIFAVFWLYLLFHSKRIPIQNRVSMHIAHSLVARYGHVLKLWTMTSK